jgi:hypothetical protein
MGGLLYLLGYLFQKLGIGGAGTGGGFGRGRLGRGGRRLGRVGGLGELHPTYSQIRGQNVEKDPDVHPQFNGAREGK